MLNENARAWVAALRSGKYKQGKGELRTKEDSYCCLGVACDLYQKAHPETQRWIKEEWVQGQQWLFEGKSGLLPASVKEWLGLRTDEGAFYDGTPYLSHKTLTGANDTGDTFEQIADLIESEPDGLFRAPAETERV